MVLNGNAVKMNAIAGFPANAAINPWGLRTLRNIIISGSESGVRPVLQASCNLNMVKNFAGTTIQWAARIEVTTLFTP